MIELYYTPEVLAFYINNHNFSEQKKMNLIHNIYHYEKAFIHPTYQNKKKLFFKKVLDFTDYLYYKDELDEEYDSIQKHMNYFGYEFTNKYILSKKPPLNFFFVTTRLQLLFNDKNYVRIKLKTLLKNYGYKRKSDKILKYLGQCLYFYHIQVYKQDNEVNLFEVESDDWLTFKLYDNYNVMGKSEIMNKKIKHFAVLFDEKIQLMCHSVNRIEGIESISYTLDDKLLINFILYTTYIKVVLHINPQMMKNMSNYSIKYYIESKNVIYNIHDISDLEEVLDIICTILSIS